MNLQAELKAFTSDGCTGFVDVWRNVNLYPCCEAHDMAWYLHPGDWVVWWHSNLDLGVCFMQVGVWELAIPAIVATSTIGAFLFAGKQLRKKR